MPAKSRRAKAAKGQWAERLETGAANAAAASALEPNNEVQEMQQLDAPTFDVAGFGEVQPRPIAVAGAHPIYLPLCFHVDDGNLRLCCSAEVCVGLTVTQLCA